MTHETKDRDPHFLIDPFTRSITNQTTAKVKLIQFDHNSERFTFEVPRYIEAHDMSHCTKIEVHYINISGDRQNQHADVYLVNDVAVSPTDAEKVTFSWLVSAGATQYAGTLSFLVRFSCLTGKKLDYVWNTTTCKSISIGEGMNNGEATMTDYSDIIASWEYAITSLQIGVRGINSAIEVNAVELQRTQGEVETLKKEVHILKLGAEGNIYTFEQDGSAAYAKPLPMTALPYATLDKVGGASSVYTNNLIPYPFAGIAKGGVYQDPTTATITDNGDGSLTFNGFYSNQPTIHLVTSDQGLTLDAGTYTLGALDDNVGDDIWYELSGTNADGSAFSITTINEEGTFYRGEPAVFNVPERLTNVAISICANGGHSADRVFPALVKGSSELVRTLEHAPVTAITVKGKNLLPDAAKDIKNWVKNGNWSYFVLNLPNGWYAMSAKLRDNAATGYLYLQSSTDDGQSYTSTNACYDGTGFLNAGYFVVHTGFQISPLWFEVKDGVTYRLSLNGSNQSQLDNIYDWQIERVHMLQTPSSSYKPQTNAPVTDYAPYIETVYPIPEAVQQLEGYGLGASDECHNYIDFEEQTFVRNCTLTQLDGTEAWQEGSAAGVFTFKLKQPSVASLNVISSEYKFTISGNGQWLIAHIAGSTLTGWVNHLKACAAAGRPIAIVQPLLDPETVDISDTLLFDGLFTAESGGLLMFENEGKKAVPNTETFQIKL